MTDAAEPCARAALVTEPGAHAARERLLDEVAAAIARRDAALHAAIGRGDAAGAAVWLASSFRVVVPSRALREHMAAALVRRVGRGVAVVSVHTHWALALETFERAGEAPPRGEASFDLFVRRAARAEPALASLDALEDGYAVVVAAARDLVDAGMTPAHAAPLLDALAEPTVQPDAVVARARAAVRATARALEAMQRAGLAPRAALLRRAAELVDARGAVLLPTAALWLYGFADATGAVTDWLQALLRAFAARAIVSIPPDPFDAGRSEADFVATLLDRLGHWAQREAGAAAGAPQPSFALLRAAGAQAEVRAVATRVRALLDDGVEPESIAIVARDLEPYRAALDAQLGRLAIPFSSSVSAGPDPRARRAVALERLLAGAARTPLDVWLDASATPLSIDLDLRVGLHVLGAARLEDWVELDLDAALGGRLHLVLPVRRGSGDEEADADARPGSGRPRARVLSRARLEAAQSAATEVVAELDAIPDSSRLADRVASLRVLLDAHLGWEADAAEAACEAIARLLPADLVLARDEFAALVTRALREAVATPLGGAGAGVAVLGVMAARGMRFAHLFALGMNREVFPRAPSPDPLLPDALRASLLAVLPDLPIKARAHAEERHHFADLVAASPCVTLSWQFASDEGRALARSAFAARLLLAHPALAVENATALERDPTPLRRAHEHAVREALVGPRRALASIRAEALRESMHALPEESADADRLACRHSLVLEALDPDPSRAAAIGPFLGLVGPRGDAAGEGLWITQVEALQRCAWQAFLRRDLGLEPLPDALEALPAMTPLLRGLVVHAVLARIVREAGAATDVALDAALEGAPVRVAWPDADRLAAWALEAAREEAAQKGIRIDGFAQALARWTLRALEVARAEDWSDAEGPLVVGAELEGAIDVAGRRVGFRADRADRRDGGLRLTDYKTGRSASAAKGEDTRHASFVDAVARGERLQAVAYALLRREPAATGRFLYVREDVAPGARAAHAHRDDGPLVAAFERSASVAFSSHALGAQPPRLLDLPSGDEGSACRWCEVRIACGSGDRDVAARLLHWVAGAARDRDALGPVERAAADTLLLGRDAPTGAEDLA